MRSYIILIFMVLSACTTKMEYSQKELIPFNSIPVRVNLDEVIKSPEKFNNMKISVAGNVAIWSETKILCLESFSEKLKLEERCLTLSFSESMYEKFKTENGGYAERISGDHSRQYVLVTGYFKMNHIPTEKEIEEIEHENGVGIPFMRTHSLLGVYRIKQLKEHSSQKQKI